MTKPVEPPKVTLETGYLELPFEPAVGMLLCDPDDGSIHQYLGLEDGEHLWHTNEGKIPPESLQKLRETAMILRGSKEEEDD